MFFHPALVIGLAAPVPRVSIGVDVGTGSARAGVVDVATGALLAVQKQNILTWTPLFEHHEQSSNDIWDACSACVRGALADAGDVEVVGIGFDATCSLVCLDGDNKPVGTDPTLPEDDERNIILWMDHRATSEAAAINDGGHERLRTVGGTISPEMEIPKIKWLREHLPDAFARVDGGGGKFLDLADFLAYRATDYQADVRSLCTVRPTPSISPTPRSHSRLVLVHFTHTHSHHLPPSPAHRWCASGTTTRVPTGAASGGTAPSSPPSASARPSSHRPSSGRPWCAGLLERAHATCDHAHATAAARVS